MKPPPNKAMNPTAPSRTNSNVIATTLPWLISFSLDDKGST